MIKNHLLIGWRNLRRQSFYSVINIAGLSIGIAACLIIVLYVINELSYDSYNTRADRIYRLNAEVKFGGSHFKMTYRSAAEANMLTQDYPEIESAVRFHTGGTYLVKTTDTGQNSKEENVIWTDSTFFRIFSVHVLSGNPITSLREPYSVAISKKIADKYFPGKPALGETLILDNNYHAHVTAVYDNIPPASHFHFDILVAMVGDWPIAREAQQVNFMQENFSTYLLLKEGADAAALERKFPQYLQKYLGPDLAKALDKSITIQGLKASGSQYDLTLMPLRDIHLYSDMRGELEPNGNIAYIWLLGSIAAIILWIAGINFVNLSTARSSTRSREVGIRKVMGSLRLHLVTQFLTESVLVTLFSIVIATLLAQLFLPVFNSLALTNLQLPVVSPMFYLALVAVAVVIGVLAGLYPAFYLSSFNPAAVLKGSSGQRAGGRFVRSALVVFQFATSIFLIIAALSVNQQLHFIQTKELGFNKDQVIMVHDAYALRPAGRRPNNYGGATVFKNLVLKESAVESATISGFIPVESKEVWRGISSMWKEGLPPDPENIVQLQQWGADYDYIRTFDMHVGTGRGFSPQFPSDSTAVVINQTAVNRLQLGDDPIGKRIKSFADGTDLSPTNTNTYTIIGVIDDFHFSSMKESIAPLALSLAPSDGFVSVRFKPGKTAVVIASIEKAWKTLAPGQPLFYSFLDEDFGRMYAGEQRLGEIFVLFASLATFIACLGLFALTAFTTERRTKEIGIRKVLGASVNGLVLLLSREFGKLVLISFLFAAPLAWYAVDRWLQGYVYKTEIGISVYLISGTIAFVIALVTMSYQSIKAASANPVNSLRSE